MRWERDGGLPSKSFICGHCGESVGSEKGYYSRRNIGDNVEARIYICHKCTKPNYIHTDGTQVPGAKYGSTLSDLPNDIGFLYDEARNSYSVNAFTSSVMCCRKILMHVAVSKGADEGKAFAYYVQYLADNHVIPNDTKDWIDEIRNAGNDANHEIKISSREEASEIISFVEMLLKLVYEYPAKMKKKTQPTT